MTYCSPIDDLVAAAPQAVQAALAQRPELVKVGLKGPGVDAWAQNQDIDLPEALYACLPVGPDGVLARVGADELMLECSADEPLLARIEENLAAPGVYRLDQQSLTLVLSGPQALAVLAQTCGLEMAREPDNRLVYTRVAGASCVILPRQEQGQQVYRLWIDCTQAQYMWETLSEIIGEFSD
ncbi:MAG: hypothetical protein GKR89_25670 [Candidatus Latescibacteria bacterium]|nr:hypothetical protein [Candidatus Latescibacterota bacterium]